MTQQYNWQNMLIGRYRTIRLLKSGNMVEVWLAEDIYLHRQMALKLLPVTATTDRASQDAFQREAQTTAQLEHPNILPIHDFGVQNGPEVGFIYLAMPYISGGSLQDRIRSAQGPLPFREALNYLRQAAQAIDYAHSRQIIHGNIRPANMLLQESHLCLINFGLPTPTVPDISVQSYMAPDQKAIPASDRYSLAVIAYQLLTGHLPFTDNSPINILIKHLNEAPPSPRQFNAALSPQVEQALLHGLAKPPVDRPTTCMALVEALERGGQESYPHDAPTHRSNQLQGAALAMPAPDPQNEPTYISDQQNAVTYISDHQQPTFASTPQSYLQDAPTRIPEVSMHERVRRQMTRRTILLGGGAVVALAAAGGVAFLYTHSQSSSGQHSTGTPSTVSRVHLTPGPAKLVSGSPLLSLTAHTQEVAVAKWDPTGRYLATGSLDSSIMLWDITSALQQSSGSVQAISAPLRSWKLPNPVFANRLSWSADGRSLAVIMDDRQSNSRIALYDAFSSASDPHTIYHIADTAGSKLVYSSIDWSPIANTFATPSYSSGQRQQRVALWQTNNTTAPLRTLTSDSSGTPRTFIYDAFDPNSSYANVNTVAWSSDGTLLAGHTNFGTVTVWDTISGKVKGELHLPDRPLPQDKNLVENNMVQVENESLAWSPTTAHMLAVSDIDLVTLWDIQQNKLLLTLKTNAPLYELTGLTWSSNGRYLAASAAGSGHIYVWDVQAASATSSTASNPVVPVLSFPQPGMQVHKASIAALDWSPDGRFIVSASYDTTAVVWKVAG